MENSNQVLDSNNNLSNVSPWPTAVKFGIIGGLFFIVTNLIQYLTGMLDIERMMENAGGFDLGAMMTGFGLTILNWIVFTVIYYLAVLAYKKELGGLITFGQGFKVAFFSAIVKAGVVLIWMLLFYFVIYPDFTESMLNFMGEMLQQSGGMDDDALEMTMTMYSYIYNPFSMAIMAGMGTISGGALLSLAAAMFGQSKVAS